MCNRARRACRTPARQFPSPRRASFPPEGCVYDAMDVLGAHLHAHARCTLAICSPASLWRAVCAAVLSERASIYAILMHCRPCTRFHACCLPWLLCVQELSAIAQWEEGDGAQSARGTATVASCVAVRHSAMSTQHRRPMPAMTMHSPGCVHVRRGAACCLGSISMRSDARARAGVRT